MQDVYWTYSFGPIDEPEAPNGVGGVLVICTETTQQVLTERRLTAERERFAQLFEQAPTFMCVLRGPTHVYELANPGYMRFVGHRPIIGRPLAEVLPEAVDQGYLATLDQVYASGEAFLATAAEYTMQIEPGGPVATRYLDFVYQPIKDADGSVSGIFVEGVDVTSRALADTALRDADRRKDEFLAMLAHELRNPLAPIRTAAEVIARKAGNDASAQRAAEVVKTAGHTTHKNRRRPAGCVAHLDGTNRIEARDAVALRCHRARRRNRGATVAREASTHCNRSQSRAAVRQGRPSRGWCKVSATS